MGGGRRPPTLPQIISWGDILGGLLGGSLGGSWGVLVFGRNDGYSIDAMFYFFSFT